MLRGTVKWFNNSKGYGFITDTEGNDVFIHYKNILMEGFRYLEEGTLVEFEMGESVNNNNKKGQAINVRTILTEKMIIDALKENGFQLRTMKDEYGVKKYLVVNADNVIQTSEDGMTFSELASYAEMPIEIAAMTTTIKE